MKNEYEIIENPNMKFLKIFIVGLIYRRPHIHNSFEICIVLKGTIQVITKKETVEYSKNSIFLFNVAQIHELKSIDNEPSLLLSLQISHKFCKNYFPLLRNIKFFDSNIVEYFSSDELQTLINNLLSISYEYFEKSPIYELKCMGEINLIFQKLLTHIPYNILSDSEKRANIKRINRLTSIIDYIENNYTQKLLLSDIAEKENLSLCYLSHFFKDNLNLTFQEYLNNLRFEKARTLLDQKNINILEACLESGFPDSRYLNKMFIKKMGCTTKEYRKRSVKKDIKVKMIETNNIQKFYSEVESSSILNFFNSN